MLIAALVALPFIWLVMPRLLPEKSVKAGHEPRRFTTMLRLGESPFAHDLPRDRIATKLPADVDLLDHAAIGGRVPVRATHHALEETKRVASANVA